MIDGALSLFERLVAGDLLIGAEASSASAGAVEIMGGLSFDVMIVDTRHAALSPYSDELERLLRAADLSNTPALVRVAENTPGTINRAMNDGAAGIVAAVGDVEAAARAAKSVRYPPRGFRGAAPVVRAARFGLTPWDDYREATNAARPVVASIETAEALEAAPSIAAVDGVDVILLDIMNLSLALNTPLRALERHDAIGTALRRLRGPDRVVGVNLPSPEGAEVWRDAGCTLLIVGTDVAAYSAATAALRADLDAVPTRLAEDKRP